MEFISGAVAGMVATFFTNPLDVLKTRIQLQGELKRPGHHEVLYKSTVQAGVLIVKKEGFLALQKGLAAALMGQGLRYGIKLGSFEWLTNRSYICDSHNRVIFYRAIIASACGGAMAAFLSTPLSKITIQLQSQAALDIAVGHQHEYSSVIKALKNIYSHYGINGLWKGATANVVRTIVGTSAQLTTFTKMKEILREYEMFQKSSFLTYLVASSAGVILQTIFQTPFDVISTRLYNQKLDSTGKGTLYQGIIHCLYKICKAEGLPGLYKGVGINYIKISRHSSLYLIIWEILKESRRDQDTCYAPIKKVEGAVDI